MKFRFRFFPSVAPCLFLVFAGCSDAAPYYRGGAGESCQARNDCAEGLACVRERCMPEGFGLEPTGKECFRVECAEKADCCADFLPDSNCALYEESCTADPSQCLAFLTLCQCNEECEDSLCVDRGPNCTVDANCAFVSTPFCEVGKCVACREHADCAFADERCVSGECIVPCVDDAECPLLYSCMAGSCVATGCASDRECSFYLGDGRASCREGVCEVPCSTDYECDQSAFEVCSDGVCVFAGCNTNAECRVVLGIESEDPGVTAECR